MSPHCPHRRRHALLVGLVVLIFLGIVVFVTADSEEGGACVLAGHGVPCSTPGSLSLEEWERIITIVPKPEPRVTWIGHPVIGKYHGDDWLATPVLDQYELGLRDDGVVVWRKKEEK